MKSDDSVGSFDPSGFSTNDNLFGLPFSVEEARVVVFPVPWEVTVSYSAGTAEGPRAVLEASTQVDLFDPIAPDAWKMGIAMMPIDEKWRTRSEKYRDLAKKHINRLMNGKSIDEEALEKINSKCRKMVQWVREETGKLLDDGKAVALIGGDHSTPHGFIQALARRNENFGILQIDAHADLRDAYEGFTYSHASIMTNALKLKQVEKLVQVGIRDYCEDEVNVIRNSGGRIKTFFDKDLKYDQYRGRTWAQQVDDILSELPEKVYISFDIDGLDPKLCPNTGTPVAGGFEADQVLFLVEALARSNKRIIGFDINEIAPGADEWDANVGARLLYRICNLMGLSQDLL